jgi:hypothetical protein
MLVFFQPGIQLLVELEVVETDGGFQGYEVDKLFLDGVGLQVDGVLVNVGNLGDVADLSIGEHVGSLDMIWALGSIIKAALRIMVRALIGLT